MSLSTTYHRCPPSDDRCEPSRQLSIREEGARSLRPSSDEQRCSSTLTRSVSASRGRGLDASVTQTTDLISFRGSRAPPKGCARALRAPVTECPPRGCPSSACGACRRLWRWTRLGSCSTSSRTSSRLIVTSAATCVRAGGGARRGFSASPPWSFARSAALRLATSLSVRGTVGPSSCVIRREDELARLRRVSFGTGGTNLRHPSEVVALQEDESWKRLGRRRPKLC